MANNVTVIPVPYTSTRSGLRKLTLDGLLSDDNNSAIRFLFDMGDSLSYVAQTNPPQSTSPVKDLSENGDGAIAATSPSTLQFLGGGLDMTNVVASPGCVSAPKTVLADLHGTIGGQTQNFMACVYIKMPSAANWNLQSGMQTVFGGGGSYFSQPNMFDMGMVASGVTLRVYRQLAANSVEQLAITPRSADYGGFGQFAYWRTSVGQFARLRTPNGITWSAQSPNGTPMARGTDNSLDYSTSPNGPYFGALLNFITATPNGVNGLRIYRGWIDNLTRETRDPVSLLDRDYVATVARGVYS